MTNLPEGITWHPGIRMWRADIMTNGKSQYIGSRETVAKASQLYQDRLAQEKPKRRPTN